MRIIRSKRPRQRILQDNPDAALIGNMRSTIYSAMNTATAYAILDGVAIPNFQNKFRVLSPRVQPHAARFQQSLDCHLWCSVRGRGPHYPAVDEGWFGLLPHRCLRAIASCGLAGMLGAFGFSINATYFPERNEIITWSSWP